MANQFDPQTWEQEQAEQRRIMAEQEAALAEEKEAAAKKRAEGEAQPNELSSEAADQERGARFGQAMAQARAKAGNRIQASRTTGAPSPELAKLDKQINELAKKAASGWQKNYLMLVVGAGVTDLLQLVGDATIVLSLISSLIGLVFSVARYLVLRFEARRIGDRKLEKSMVARTFISGAVSIIPLVNMLPENLTAMLLEWVEREKIAREADAGLRKLRPQREAMLAAQQASEAQELEQLAV